MELRSQDFAQVPPSGPPESAVKPTVESAVNTQQLPTPLSSKEAVVAHDKALGGNVHQFDPDASPEEKAAKIAKEQASIAEGAHLGRTNVGAAVVTDIGTSKADAPKPTVNLQDAERATAQEAAAPKDAQSQNVPRVKLKDGKIPDLTEDHKVGWQALVKKVEDVTQIDAQQARDVVTELIGSQHLGTVWHNAAIIFFAVGAAHFATRFGGGIPLCILIGAACATYYSTSIQRVRHRARDDISRELAKQRLFTEHESADWINNFLRRFWLAYEPLLSATIVLSVDQVLSENCPGFLESLRLTTFTLGNKAPRLEFVRTFADTDDETVVMDMKISFTPNDTADLTAIQAASRVNPKIVLSIKIGKGVATIGKDVVVEDISFTGLMRFKLKLMSNFPNIKTVEFSFMEKPLIDFVLKPIGFDLSLIPGLNAFIDNQLHANLGPMMYDPNSFVIDLEQLLSGAPIDTAIGVLQVTVFNARGLKATKIGGGTPDPYVSFSISQRAELARSKIKHSTANPQWNDTKFILVNSLNDVLALSIMDWNEHRKDSDLGLVNFSLKSLEQDPQQERVVMPVLQQGKEKGTLQFGVNFFPVVQSNKAKNETGSEEAVPDSRSGIVRLTIHQARELDLKRTVSHSQANPYARVFLQNKPVASTRTLKRTIAPAWEHAVEFLVTDKPSAVIGVKVVDERGLSSDPVLGYVNVKLQDLIDAKAKQKDWFPLSGCSTGRIRLTAEFKPVMMTGAFNGAQAYTAPIGVVRIWFKRAVDLKNVEALTGGKSDPYVRVLERGIVMSRTEVINNNLNPEWDEIVYIPVRTLKDRLVLEVMDYQEQSKDRSLGMTDLLVSSLAKEGTDKTNRPFEPTGKIEGNALLQSDGKKTVKGTLYYQASFASCYPMPDISFDAPPAVEKPVLTDTDTDDAETIRTHDDPHEADEPVYGMVADAQRLETEAKIQEVEEKQDTEVPTTATSASIHMQKLSREDLLKTQTGILVIHLISGTLAKRARLEVLMDSGYWPAYTTEKARSQHATFDEVGEIFIRELDYSRILFKLNESDRESNADVFAEAQMDLNEFLETALDRRATITLNPTRYGGEKSSVTLVAKYIPADVTIEARESVNNTGVLRLEVLDGKDLRAMDRNGYSDPYAVIELNGEKLWKSTTKKKTLKPVWNESTEFAVQSRTAAQCWLKIYDWDALGKADKLGQARIDLGALAPFTSSTVALQLKDQESGQPAGTVNVRMVFRPEFLNRTRAATSTFSGVQRVGTGVAGAGKGIIGGGAKFASKGVGGAAYRVTHGGHGRKTSVATADTSYENSIVDESGALPSSSTVLTSQTNGTTPSTPSKFSLIDGTLKLTVQSAKAEGEKAHVSLKHDGKSVDKSHDVFTVKTGKGPDLLAFTMVDKKAFGKDKPLGNLDIHIWDVISPNNGPTELDHSVPFGSDGKLDLHFSWVPSFSPGGSSGNANSSPASVKSKSRFSKFGLHMSTPEKNATS